jgi:hypothetical protein
MKNLSKLLIATAVVVGCCFISCSKQENLITQSSGDISTLKSNPIVCGEVFTVFPSGNYNDDSNAIQTALNNAVAAGAGSTVQLTAGTFYLKYRIEVEGFDGFFKGAGKEKTIITTHDVIEFNLPTDDMESLIKFRHGNIKMSDLAIKITNPNPCTGLNDHGWGFNTALPNVITITGNSCSDPGESYQAVSATFNNVKFVGGAGDYQPYPNGGRFNVGKFVWRSWDAWDWNSIYTLHGDYKFTNCDFQTAYTCIASDVSNGPCIIGGAESSGNKFEDTYYATLIVDMSNSYANVSYNHYSKIYYSGVQFWQGANVDVSTISLSKYLVYGNDIEVRPFDPENPYEYFTNGIALWDLGFSQGVGKKIDANISNNKIFLNNCNGGIFGYGPKDIIASNNKIWGNGWAGIYCGIWEDPSTKWVIKGNNVQGVNAEVAPIWLGSATSNCLVYADKEDVLDEGTNNILIGAHNKRSDHPSSDIKKNMMRHQETMNSFRSHR